MTAATSIVTKIASPEIGAGLVLSGAQEVEVTLTIVHVVNALYQVSSAGQFRAGVTATGCFETAARDDHEDIFRVIEGLNPYTGLATRYRTFVGQLYPDGRLRALDNTRDKQFIRWLHQRQTSCLLGERCNICGWCSLQEAKGAGSRES